MREIEFRAWVDYGNGCGEMLPNVQNHISGDWAFGNMLMNNVRGCDFKIMQYTGLKDCAGSKIFEGDLIRWAFGQYIQVSEVYYCPEKAAFRQRLISTNQKTDNGEHECEFLERIIEEESCQNIICDRWSEIIGNIHEAQS